MELTLYREEPILREARHLPAGIYNQTRLLLARAMESGAAPCVFVPIRSMQYLAIIDQEEIVFVDREYPGMVQMAGQDFHRQERNALDERVQFEVAFYTRTSLEILPRLQGDLPKALQLMVDKDRIEHTAAVLPFPAHGNECNK
jgi:hypothetical protein